MLTASSNFLKIHYPTIKIKGGGMYKNILVPIDIDEDNLMNKAIPLVEDIAKMKILMFTFCMYSRSFHNLLIID